eukprot:SAG22_NODE_40_length_25739_cov_38.630031_5_plen_4683_part_00
MRVHALLLALGLPQGLSCEHSLEGESNTTEDGCGHKPSAVLQPSVLNYACTTAATALVSAPSAILIGPGPLSAKASYACGPALSIVDQGRRQDFAAGNTLHIHARDAYGNARVEGSDSFALDPLMQSDITAIQRHTSNGVYEMTFWWVTTYEVVAFEICPQPTSAETAYPFACKAATSADDRIIAAVTARVVESSASLQKRDTDLWMTATGCAAGPTGSCGDSIAVAGSVSNFVIEAFSEFGPSYGSEDAFGVQLVGPALVTANVTHSRLHFYDVEYTPVVAGTYRMYISLDDAIYSKQAVKVVPGRIDPQRSNLTYAYRANAGDKVSVIVSASDAHGNQMQVADGQVTIQATGCDICASVTSPIEVNTGGAAFRLNVAASYEVSAQARGESPAGEDYITINGLEELHIKAGDPAAGTAKFVNFRDTLVADERQTFSVQAYDTFGNTAETSLRVKVVVLGQDGVPLATAFAGGETAYAGPHAATFDNLSPGHYTIIASGCDDNDECVPHDRTAFSVIPGAIHLASSELIAGSHATTAGEPFPVRVRLRDRFGNPVADRFDVSIDFSTADGSLDSSVSLCSTCVADAGLQYLGKGEFQGSHTITAAGSYSPTFRIDGTLVHTGRDFQVNYGTQASPKVWPTSQTGPNNAVHGRVHEVTTVNVELLDIYGNTRTCNDAHVDIRLVPEVSPLLFRRVIHADGAGVYSVSFQVDHPGTFLVQVSLLTDAGQSIPALVDGINAANGFTFVNQDAVPAASAIRRRTQVEIEYEIELQLTEEQIDAMLSGDDGDEGGFNASALMEQQMASVQSLMTSDNFSSALIENVQSAGNSSFFENISAEDIVAPNITELQQAFASAEVAEPEFLGTIQVSELPGDGSRTTTCGETSTFDIRVYDEFNNQQQSGLDVINIVPIAGDIGNNGSFAVNFSSAFLVEQTDVMDYVYSVSYVTQSCFLDTDASSTVAFNITVNDKFMRTQVVGCVTGDIRGTTAAQPASEALSRGTANARMAPNAPATLTAGDREEIIVQARDLFGNLKTEFGDLSRFVVTVTIPAHQERPTVNDPFVQVPEATHSLQDLIANGCAACGLLEDSVSGPGQYKIIYETLYAGVYTVEIRIADSVDGSGGSDGVTHSPFTATVSAGPINPIFCEVTVSVGASTVNANDVAYVAVELYDQYKNPVADLPPDANGLQYYADIEEVANLNTRLTCGSSVCPTICESGSEFASSDACVTATSGAQNRLRAAFTSTIAQEFTIVVDYVTLNTGTGIEERRPFDSTNTHTVTFAPLGFDRDQTVFLSGVDRLTDCTAGEVSRMRLQLRDQFQNINSDSSIADSRWLLTLTRCSVASDDRTSCTTLSTPLEQISGDVRSSGCAETECGPGEYEAFYTLPRTGDYTVELKLDNTHMTFVTDSSTDPPTTITSPRLILSDIPAEASVCTASPETDSSGAERPGFSALVAGDTGTFMVQSQGLAGGNPEPRRGSGDNFIVTLVGATMDSVGAVQTYTGNGLYTVSYTAFSSDHVTSTWDYTISIQLESAMTDANNPVAVAGPTGIGHILGSPFSATMSPSVSASPYTFATGDALTAGVAGQVMAFTVTGRDTFNNVITECTDASFTGVGDAFPTSPAQIVASPCADATYQWEYMIERAGFYNFGILFNGVDIGSELLAVGSGSPFNATIASSSVSGERSYIDSTSDLSSSIVSWLPVTPPSYTDQRTVAGTSKTMFVHTFDTFGNRLTQAPCSGGDADASCFTFGFVWCQVDFNLTALTDVEGCAISGDTIELAASDQSAAYLGAGVFQFNTRLTRSGGYRADLAVTEVTGTAIQAANVPQKVAVVPAAAAATHTLTAPPETVQADTPVEFEMSALDEFDNYVYDADLVFQLSWGTCVSSLADQCFPHSDTASYNPDTNRYTAGFRIDTSGVAARLPLTISLVVANQPVPIGAQFVVVDSSAAPSGADLLGNYLIRVRAPQNDPPKCFLITDGSRDALTDGSADWLNPDEKRAGDSLNLRVRSVTRSDRWRTVENECSEAEILADNTDNCDLLDEFELFAVHTSGYQPDSDAAVAGNQPFQSDCTETSAESLAASPNDPDGLALCQFEGQYKIDWATTISGDYTVTVKSLGVTIQTAGLVGDREVYPFNLTELNGFGYTMPLPAMHIYPAKMDAGNSVVHLQTPCDPGLIVHIPCADIGVRYVLSVVAKDMYGNHLERDGASTQTQGTPGGVSEAMGLAYMVKPVCAGSEQRCASYQDTAHDFFYDTEHVGTYRTTVAFRAGGPMELEIKYLDVEAGQVQVDGVFGGELVSGEALTVISKIAVGPPTPNNGETNGAVAVTTKAYGLLDYNAQSVTPTFICEWTGPAVEGSYTVPATVLGESTNRVRVVINITVGPEALRWRLQTGSASSAPSASGGPYSSDNGGCADNLQGLQQFVTDEAGEHVSRIVDWTTQTSCASVLDRLHHHNVHPTDNRGTWSCNTPGRLEGSQPVKDFCPYTCGFCNDDTNDTLTVDLDLAGGDYTWAWAEFSTGAVNGTITVTDSAGLTLLPTTAFDSMSADPLQFTVHGARIVRCDGGAPVIADLSGDPRGQVGFRIGTTYAMTGTTPVSQLFQDHTFDSSRVYASANGEFFYFYEHPTFAGITLDATQEIYPGIAVFSSDRPAPDFGGQRVWVAQEGGSRVVINGFGFDNGAAASKEDYECHFNGTNDLITPARYLSNHSISCVVPALDGVDQDYEISISKNGEAVDRVQTGLYVRPFVSTGITPTFAAVQGWGFALVTLANAFTDPELDAPTAYCRFGSFTYPSSASTDDAPRAGPGPRVGGEYAPNPRDRDRTITNPFEGTLPSGSLIRRPLSGTIGDVVDAILVDGADGVQTWSCPMPDIQDSGDLKPRNMGIDVAISYDGISFTNPSQIFLFDQPDFEPATPPIGPTGGGTPIDMWSVISAVTPDAGLRDYGPIYDEIVPWCKFKSASGRGAPLALDGECLPSQLVNGQCPREGPNLAIKPAEKIRDGSRIGFRCNTPSNPDPGASYFVEISLDDRKTWAFESDDSERYRAFPRFVYYAETAVITTTASYAASADFRARIDLQRNPVGVRFDYSCGYTRNYPELIRCRYGCMEEMDPNCPENSTVMYSNATLIDIGATVTNAIACDVPIYDETAILKMAISLNGIDYTPLTSETNFVYFGAAVSLFARWQADASSQAAVYGQTWTQAAERLTRLPVVYVDIRDNKGSFVSEDQYAGNSVRLTIQTKPDPNSDNWFPVAGESEDKQLGSAIEEAGVPTPEDIGNCLRRGTVIENCVPGKLGSTMFVNLDLDSPQSAPEYRAEVAMGVTDQYSGWVNTLDPYYLVLTIITGVTSIPDTLVAHTGPESVPPGPIRPQLDVLPGSKFILQLQAKDSAGNSIVTGGDKFRTRLYLTEGSIACGLYVRPTLPATVTVGMSATAAQANARRQCPNACRADGDCVGSDAGQNLAYQVLQFTVTNRTTGEVQTPLLCTDEYGGPICSKFDADSSQNVPITKPYSRVVGGERVEIPARVKNYDGVGGYYRPDVVEFDDAASPAPGQYILETGFTMSDARNRVPSYETQLSDGGEMPPLRLWGDFTLFVEGLVTAGRAEQVICPEGTESCSVDEGAANLGWKNDGEGGFWAPISDPSIDVAPGDPFIGVVTPVDCAGDTNPAPLTPVVANSTQGAHCSDPGGVCLCTGDVRYGEPQGTGWKWSAWVRGVQAEMQCDKTSFEAAPAQGEEAGVSAGCFCRGTTQVYLGWDPRRGPEDGAQPDAIGSQCTCSAGFEMQMSPRAGLMVGQVDCETCFVGKYKNVDDTIAQVSTGNPCTECPVYTSTVERGSASHLDCLCADGYYDFRNTMIVCFLEKWFRIENDKPQSVYGNTELRDVGHDYNSFINAKASATRCLKAPSCVTTTVDGSITIAPGFWLFPDPVDGCGDDGDGDDYYACGKNKPETYFDNFKDDTKPGLNSANENCIIGADGTTENCGPGQGMLDTMLGAQAYKNAGKRYGGLETKLVLQVYKCMASPKGKGNGDTCAGGDHLWYRNPSLYNDGWGGCFEGSEGVTCSACAKPNDDGTGGYKKGETYCVPCDAKEEDEQPFWVQAIAFLLGLIIGIAAIIGAGILLKRAKMEDVLKMKILVAFCQVVQSFADTYQITWPDELRDIFVQFSIFNIEIFSVGSVECSPTMGWVKTYYYRFVFIILVLPSIFGMFVVGYFVEVQLEKRKLLEREQETGQKMSVLEAKINDIEATGRWLQRFFLCCVMLYLKVSKTVLEMFAWRNFEPEPATQWTKELALIGDDYADPDGGARGFLESDMNLSTDTWRFTGFFGIGVVMAIVYPFGIPVVLMSMMWRERDQIHDAINQKKFGFLFADYVSVYFLWECWDLFRKLALSGLFIFFNRGSIMQLVGAMLFSLLALEMHIWIFPYADKLANYAQLVAFNAIFLNLIGAMMLRIPPQAGVDGAIGENFAKHLLTFINIVVPLVVLSFVGFSVGYDMYLMSIGKVMKGGLAGQSRTLLLAAIGARKENRVQNVKRRKNVAEKGLALLYHTLWKREDVDDALLAEELAYVEKRRDERDKSIILFRQAQVHLEEKREWYRFVYNNSKTEEEFNEIVQTESLASYKRLMLGLDEDEEDDIHERVTREITQAGNQADDVVEEGLVDVEADMDNPMFDVGDEEQPKEKKKKVSAVLILSLDSASARPIA